MTYLLFEMMYLVFCKVYYKHCIIFVIKGSFALIVKTSLYTRMKMLCHYCVKIYWLGWQWIFECAQIQFEIENWWALMRRQIHWVWLCINVNFWPRAHKWGTHTAYSIQNEEATVDKQTAGSILSEFTNVELGRLLGDLCKRCSYKCHHKRRNHFVRARSKCFFLLLKSPALNDNVWLGGLDLQIFTK